MSENVDVKKQVDGIMEAVDKVVKRSDALGEGVESVTKAMEELRTEVDDKVKAVVEQQAKYSKTLSKEYGKSGERDFYNDFNKYVAGAYHASKGLKVPEWCKVDGSPLFEKANEYTVGTAGTAGYLAPTFLYDAIVPLLDMTGNIYPLTTKTTCPAGHTLKVNRISANATAVWKAEAAASTQESTLTFAQDTVVPAFLGKHAILSNEMFTSPGINYGGVMAGELVKAWVRGVENYLIQNDAGTSGPSDGFLIETGPNSQTAIATATFALVTSFLQECYADNAAAPDRNNYLWLTHHDLLALATEAVGAAELTGMLVWGDPRKGYPTTLLGYPVVAHSSMTATNDYIALGNPRSIVMAEDPSFAIDFDGSVGFISNNTYLRVFRHVDWSLGQLDEWHKAVVTNA